MGALHELNFAMEPQRFIFFRVDFHKLYNIIIKDSRPETISSQFTALRQVYPELDFNVALPDLVVKDATVPMPMDVDIKYENEKKAFFNCNQSKASYQRGRNEVCRLR